MSTGWITVVAVIPARPPFMKGSAARMKGVWRKSFLVLMGFSAADFMAAEVSLRRLSVEAFAESRARVGGIFIADMV